MLEGVREPQLPRSLLEAPGLWGLGEVGGLWLHLPPVALFLVELQLILVNIELLHQGITVGST